MDLLSSGRQPSPEQRVRPWLARGRRLWRRRGARVGAAVLVAAAVLVLLQLTAHPQQVLEQAEGPPAAASPVPPPPYDQRPGRTPIPTPTLTGDLLSGLLPATGDPGPGSAIRAADLVLGRYCADPGRYGLTVEPYTVGRSFDFRRTIVVVVDRLLTDSGRETRLALEWAGRAYRWSGPLDLARGC